MSTKRWSLLLIGILLLAANLRLPITSIGPVIQNIGQDFQLSSAALGLLTTLPLLAFAIISPLAPKLAQRIGLNRSLGICLIVIIIGFTGRLLPSLPMFYLSTALIGAGIAIGNVLLPSLVKQRYPDKIALITSIYAFTMSVAAALASMWVLPLTHFWQGQWAWALGSFVLLPILSLVLWLPQCRHEATPTQAPNTQAVSSPSKPMWHHGLAWQVTIFLGLNSMIYYSIITWLPSMLQDASYTAAQAGSLHGWLQMASALPGFLLVPLIRRCADQRLPATLFSGLMLFGLLGLAYLPQYATIWAIAIGFGSGGTILLGLMFMGLRTQTPQKAASLSAMAQSIGYLLAAAAPPLFGLLQQQQASWLGVLWILSIAAFIVLINGLGAGRNLKIS